MKESLKFILGRRVWVFKILKVAFNLSARRFVFLCWPVLSIQVIMVCRLSISFKHLKKSSRYRRKYSFEFLNSSICFSRWFWCCASLLLLQQNNSSWLILWQSQVSLVAFISRMSYSVSCIIFLFKYVWTLMSSFIVSPFQFFQFIRSKTSRWALQISRSKRS